MGYTLEGNEMSLIVRPVMQNDEWTGHVETGIACSSEIDLDSSLQGTMVHYITLMAAFLSWGNDNPDILDEVIAFRDGLLAEKDGWDIDGDYEQYQTDGTNVIRLNRWTKTEGSA